MKIAILGDGGWGTTLAICLSRAGHDVRLWGAFPDYIEVLRKKRENVKFLPGIKIPKPIDLTADIVMAVKGAEFIVLAVPSQYMREVMQRLKECDYSSAKFVSVAKGIENETLLRMSEVILELLGDVPLAVLSGPTIAYEVSRSLPTTAVVASGDARLSKELQSIFMSEELRVYASTDVIGVELGGALKNIIAIASGVADGLGFGSNSKAAILTRGLQELTRLGLAMGAKKETFSGLSCMGDLITTCMSKHSRNRWLGEEIGRGKKLRDIVKSTEMVVEGIATTKSAYELSKKYKTEMPITNEIYEILYNNKDPRKAVRSLMTRAPKDE